MMPPQLRLAPKALLLSIERQFARSTRLQRLRDYVHLHIQDAISLRQAAGEVGLERTYFSAYFRRTTGHRFHTWVQLVRINRALELLESDLSITQLAYAVGYQDLTTFERAFKQTTGLTPSLARKVLRATGHSTFAEN